MNLRSQIVELGRACIHPEHRKYEVLMLLWKAIARYACDHGGRYLIGCCSLNSQDRAAGSAVYRALAPALAPEGLRTSPLGDYGFELSDCRQEARPPKLLRAYLSLGANICGEPAIDQQFKTIDFLTLMDLNNLAASVRTRLGV
jgi:putative hemolysin